MLITAGESEAGARRPLSHGARRHLAVAADRRKSSTRPIAQRRPRLGERHPVVRGLPDPARWGRWTRADRCARHGRANRALRRRWAAAARCSIAPARAASRNSGRISSWLWARGYDGGGPHGELLRRLAHWLMQEPELEDERLTLDPGAARSCRSSARRSAMRPSRSRSSRHRAQHTTLTLDASRARRLSRRSAGDRARLVRSARRQACAPSRLSARSIRAKPPPLAADPDILRPFANATGGSVVLTGEDGRRLPEIRRVDRGATAQRRRLDRHRAQRRLCRARRAPRRSDPAGPGRSPALRC